MINYHKNKLINECLEKYYETFSRTLDTADFVPEDYNEKIIKYIFKNMRKAFKRVDKEDRRYQKELEKAQKAKQKAERKLKKKSKRRR
jgi:Na+/phosphate symporter